MKRWFYLITISIVITNNLFSQSYFDVYRITEVTSVTTSRSAAVANSFGAFGGDFSSIYTNPAGLGIYRKSEFTFTPSFSNFNFKSEYFGTHSEDYSTRFGINQFGLVLASNSQDKTGWSGFALAIGYVKHNVYNTNRIISGKNNYTSLSDYFMSYANGLSPDSLDPFYEWVAYDAYVIDEYEPRKYETPVPVPIYQRKTFDVKGGLSEYSVAMAINFENYLYLGLTFSLFNYNYDELKKHREEDVDNLSDFKSFTFTEDLESKGNGFSARFGLIARPIDYLRIGFSATLPTVLKVKDRFTTSMISYFDNGNKYEGYPQDYDGNRIDYNISEYKMVSPLKLSLSGGIQFSNFGLIGGEIEYVPYSMMRLRSVDPDLDFEGDNQLITDIFRNVYNFKLGGEIRFNHIYLRSGFNYYPSPYRKGELNENMYKLNISSGIGIRTGNFFIDFAGLYSLKNEKYNLYEYGDNIANLKDNKLYFNATIGISF